jgi:hypothetical protein
MRARADEPGIAARCPHPLEYPSWWERPQCERLVETQARPLWVDPALRQSLFLRPQRTTEEHE